MHLLKSSQDLAYNSSLSEPPTRNCVAQNEPLFFLSTLVHKINSIPKESESSSKQLLCDLESLI